MKLFEVKRYTSNFRFSTFLPWIFSFLNNFALVRLQKNPQNSQYFCKKLQKFCKIWFIFMLFHRNFPCFSKNLKHGSLLFCQILSLCQFQTYAYSLRRTQRSAQFPSVIPTLYVYPSSPCLWPKFAHPSSSMLALFATHTGRNCINKTLKIKVHSGSGPFFSPFVVHLMSILGCFLGPI